MRTDYQNPLELVDGSVIDMILCCECCATVPVEVCDLHTQWHRSLTPKAVILLNTEDTGHHGPLCQVCGVPIARDSDLICPSCEDEEEDESWETVKVTEIDTQAGEVWLYMDDGMAYRFNKGDPGLYYTPPT